MSATRPKAGPSRREFGRFIVVGIGIGVAIGIVIRAFAAYWMNFHR